MLGKPEIIGVDIGQYSIKIARVKQTGKSFTANHLAYEVIPPDVRQQRDRVTLGRIVAGTLKKQKLSKGLPVLHINTGDAIMREVTVDAGLRGNELEGAIELELNDAIPFGMDQVYFDFDEVPNKRGTRLVVAVRRDVADEKTALLNNLPKTFTAPHVDVDAFAFNRVLNYVARNDSAVGKGGRVMLIDIGFNRSRFYVCKGGELLFSREQQIGGNTVNEIIMDVFDIDAESAENRKIGRSFGDEYRDLVLTPYVQTFTEQLHLAMDFYEANNVSESADPIRAIYLTGGGSRLSGFVEALGTANVSHNIRLLNLAPYVKLSGSQRSDEALQSGINHALAIGLAMEGTN
ncbi:type IV pilus assembly protein PilM [uncultured Cardiobacterium sp.]|uniref:type IV pilus assembly protein PilM n=1 Tax=uncultured Cardiobacterium sp. TaxID=417619 RepID=UPI00263108D9|nr:type IV pilus assembly protein PilM [uncultured Cardiobacterium sp.]